MKYTTHKLRITLRVKCMHGYLKPPTMYLINYSQYHVVLLLLSQSEGNLSEYVLHSYLISARLQKAVKYFTIPEDDWLGSLMV